MKKILNCSVAFSLVLLCVLFIFPTSSSAVTDKDYHSVCYKEKSFCVSNDTRFIQYVIYRYKHWTNHEEYYKIYPHETIAIYTNHSTTFRPITNLSLEVEGYTSKVPIHFRDVWSISSLIYD
jgi:hypothetical protein